MLDELGVDLAPPAWGGTWGSGLCPMHEDRNPSFRVDLASGGWKCHAGCGQHGDLAVLVHMVTGEDLQAARKRLQDYEPPPDLSSLERVLRAKAAVQEALAEDEDGFPEPEGEDLSYVRDRVPRYIVRRGFTPQTLKAWGVGSTEAGDGVVIPVTRDGELVGLVTRPLVHEPGRPRYLNTHFEKREVLFGEDQLPAGARTIALVEGPLDAMWLWQHEIPAVATLGGPPSDWQVDRLVRRAWDVVLAFDADKAGVMAARSAGSLRRRLSRLVLWTIDLPPGVKDVQDVRDPDQLREIFEQRRRYL